MTYEGATAPVRRRRVRLSTTADDSRTSSHDSPETVDPVENMAKAISKEWLAYCLPAGLASLAIPRWIYAKHIKFLEEKILRIVKGESIRVGVSLPPRSGKTYFLSRVVPAWFLGRFPDKRVLLITNHTDLSRKQGRYARNILTQFGKDVFGVEVSDQTAAAGDWEIAGHEGGMEAVGAGANIQGKGAHLLLLDDIITGYKMAVNTAQLDDVWEWLNTDVFTRLEPNASVVLINTRWCLLPGTFVQTNHGFKKIEEVNTNDFVLGLSGTQKVSKSGVSGYFDGDVVSIKVSGLPDPVCCTPNHKVFTDRGWVRADKVSVGDKLFYPKRSFNGNSLKKLKKSFPPVPESQAKRKVVLSERAKQILPKKILKKLLDDGKTYQEISNMYGHCERVWSHSYALAYGLNKGRFCAFDDSCLDDPEFWWTVGFWVAEGFIDKNRAIWCLGYHEPDRAEKLIEILKRYSKNGVKFSRNKNYGNMHTDRKYPTISVRCSSVQLVEFLEDFGLGAHNKKIPNWLIDLPDDFKKQFCLGLFEGDGCLGNNGNNARLGSVSNQLMFGLREILLSLGCSSCVFRYPGHNELTVRLCDASWLNWKDLDVIERSRPDVTKVFCDVDGLWHKVTAVENIYYKGPLYDLSTPDHSFVANGVIVHNSPLDPIGRLEEYIKQDSKYEKWEIINLPALAGPDDPLGREVGDPLFPERFDKEQVLAIMHRMDPFWWSALYDGQPSPAKGAVINVDWLQRYVSPPAKETADSIVLSVDTAMKDTELSDFTVFGVWFVKAGAYYLIDVVRERMQYGVLRETAVAMHNRWMPNFFLIEDKGSGTSLIQQLRDDHPGMPVEAINPGNESKIIRMETETPELRAGRVYIPQEGGASWLHDYIEELRTFPKGRKDQVDMTSQFLRFMRENFTQRIDMF